MLHSSCFIYKSYSAQKCESQDEKFRGWEWYWWGHSVLRWAVAGGHDSALIATWITPCICYQACNRNAIIAII